MIVGSVYLVEIQLIKQVHEPLVLAIFTEHGVVLYQSVQRKLGLIINIHLHRLHIS